MKSSVSSNRVHRFVLLNSSKHFFYWESNKLSNIHVIHSDLRQFQSQRLKSPTSRVNWSRRRLPLRHRQMKMMTSTTQMKTPNGETHPWLNGSGSWKRMISTLYLNYLNWISIRSGNVWVEVTANVAQAVVAIAFALEIIAHAAKIVAAALRGLARMQLQLKSPR